ERLDKVAGFEPGLVLAIDHDRLAAPHGHGVNFDLAKEVGAHGVDVRPLGDPVAVEHRLPARRGGDDDVFILRGQFGTRHRLDFDAAYGGHFAGEAPTVLLVGAVDLDAADLAHLAYRFKLRPRLFAAAEEAHLASVRPGHVLRRHATGGA